MAGDKPALDDHLVAIPQAAFVITIDFYNRNDKPLPVKIEVTQPVSIPEGLAAIFEITDIVSMPNDP